MRFLCVLAMLLSGPAALAGPIPDYPFVFTSGTADTDIAPDIVRLTFEVSARDPDGAKALAVVLDNSNQVIEILTKADVKTIDIDASSINKSEEREWDEQLRRSVSDGFVVTRRFKVTVRDLTKYPEMGRALLQLPTASHFNPTFSRTDRDKIEADLFERAARDAAARAERMAASFGRKLGAVRAISQVPFSEFPHWLGFGESGRAYSAMYEGGAPKTDAMLIPATIPIAVDVNVVFELQ